MTIDVRAPIINIVFTSNEFFTSNSNAAIKSMESDKSKKNQRYSLLFIFESAMSVFYLAMAYLLLCTELFTEKLITPLRIGFGVLMILYGVFRIYRSFRKYKTLRDENK